MWLKENIKIEMNDQPPLSLSASSDSQKIGKSMSMRRTKDERKKSIIHLGAHEVSKVWTVMHLKLELKMPAVLA